MSTYLQSDTASVPAKREFPKIDKVFDTALHIVERSEALLSRSKSAVVNLFLLIHLVVDLIIVLTFVLGK